MSDKKEVDVTNHIMTFMAFWMKYKQAEEKDRDSFVECRNRHVRHMDRHIWAGHMFNLVIIAELATGIYLIWGMK